MGESFSHIISFGFVGAVGMILDFCITYLLKEKLGMNKFLANAIGFVFAVCNNYLMNKYWTYGEMGKITIKQILSFAIVSCVGLLLNSVLLYVFNRCLKVSFYFSKLIAIIIVFIWNFGVNNFITFN